MPGSGSVLNSTHPRRKTLPRGSAIPTMIVCIFRRENPMSAGQPKLKPQHAPNAPHEDPRFLESTPARPLRILAEYLHPLVQLKKEGIADTIVMFGSARIEPREIAQARCTRLKNVNVRKLAPSSRTRHRADVRHAK